MQYFYAQQEHMKVLDKKEEEKQKLIRDKVQVEKSMRDKQMKKTEHKKRKELRENMQEEQDTIQRLVRDMDKERQVA